MSFRFTPTAIDTAEARRELQDLGCGGYVSFEGWVRNQNEGQDVVRLEYEAFQELAEKEGDHIIAEALRCRPVPLRVPDSADAASARRAEAADFVEVAIDATRRS